MSSISLHVLLKARLELVREDLSSVVERLTDDMLPWAPSPGMRTIGGQLAEIGGTEVQLMTWIREGRHLPYDEAMAGCHDVRTVSAVEAWIRVIRADTLLWIDSRSELEIETPIPFPDRWFESLRLPMAPPSEAVRSLAQHEWYHVGQLVSYLWARGDDPYKW